MVINTEGEIPPNSIVTRSKSYATPVIKGKDSWLLVSFPPYKRKGDSLPYPMEFEHCLLRQVISSATAFASFTEILH